MNVVYLDHLVITVDDISTTVDFYESILGMKKTVFANNRVALLFGNQKINLHPKGGEFEPKAQNPIPGSADLCFIINTPIENAIEHLHKHHIHLIEGPVTRTGATGPIKSVYFRDPDGNLIEISNYE